MLILGIDPGSRVTGYGLIEGPQNPRAVTWGTISLAEAGELPKRLALLHQRLQDLLKHFQPEAIALEEIVPERFPRNILRLGQAQGIVFLVAGEWDIPLFTYHPLTVKTELVGYGKATKEQVIYMVKQTLGISQELLPDEADALAVALTHLYRQSRCWPK